MASSRKRKGTRIERELVHKHEKAGIPCKRVPGSGAFEGLPGDLMGIAGRYRAEVKSRKGGAGFVTLERWLGGNDLLFLRRDYREPLVVMEWEMYVALMKAWQEQERGE